jgi:poly-gamma-glutamate capsule biosynthesis protein CapA/YwtB (metallophosphatase superfamily)
VYEFAHAMVDAGADIVFGQGPHVARGVEMYKDKFISYSLGNFLHLW